MARNLTRNTKLYISNQAVLGSCTSANTWEVKVLDGYSFSQATTTEDITISEAGANPIRGQKTFNVAQEPVDISIGTYIRPYDNTQSLIDAPERILWASLAGRLATVVNADGDMVVGTGGNGNPIVQSATGTGMLIDFEESDSNELAKLTMWFNLENSTYRVDNVNISTAEIDFAIDGIAMVNWSGQGTAIAELSAADHATVDAWTAGTGVAGDGDYRPTPVTSSASFLRNKLSTMSLQNNEVGTALVTGTGTATGGTTATLVDTVATFTTDAVLVAGDYVRYSDDAFATWETKVIQAVTNETTLTIEGTWDTIPTTGSYEFYAATDKGGQGYTLAITGGNLTIENNMNFLTPEELGVVNQPLPGFAESRGVTGTITAYLDTGFYGTAALLQDVLENINSPTNSYNFNLSIGGIATALKRVDLQLATAQLAVPTINVEDVIATEITFAGQGSAGLLENQDEVIVTYHSD